MGFRGVRRLDKGTQTGFEEDWSEYEKVGFICKTSDLACKPQYNKEVDSDDPAWDVELENDYHEESE